MKKTPVYLIIVILLAAVAVWFFVFKDKKRASSDSETSAPYVSRHSAAFIQSLRGMMESYYKLTEAFVNWDTAIVAKYSTELNSAIENLKMEELKIDDIAHQKALSGIAAVKSDMTGIIKSINLDEQRQSLNKLSCSLYSFLILSDTI